MFSFQQSAVNEFIVTVFLIDPVFVSSLEIREQAESRKLFQLPLSHAELQGMVVFSKVLSCHYKRM